MEEDKEEEEDEMIGRRMDKVIRTREMAATAGPETPCRRILRAAGADAAEEKVGGGGAEECVLVDPEVEGGGTHLIYQREPVPSSTMGAANTATIAKMSTSRTRMDTARGIREEEKDYRTRIRWEFLDCKVNCRECKDSAPVLFIIFFATLK